MSLTKLYIKEHYPLALTIVFLISLISGMVFLISDLVATDNTILKGKISKCSQVFTRFRSSPRVRNFCHVDLESGETVKVTWLGQIKYPEKYPVAVLVEEKKGKKVGNKDYILIGLQ